MNTLKEKHKAGEFTITVELDPPKSASAKITKEQASTLKGLVDGINIADCPMAKMRMSPIALAHIIQEDCGIETIFHLTCRDRNYIGLQAELLGAAGLGVHNILTLTGDNPQSGDTPQAKAVFETDTCGLIRLAHTLNTGTDINKNALGAATHFYIGAAANPGTSDQSLEMAKLANKVSSGAEFIQTQPIYDLEVAKRFIDNASQFNIPILLGLMPLRGIKMATYLESNVPGISIPRRIMDRLRKGGLEAGIEIAREQYTEIRKLSAGVHIMPMNHIDVINKIVKA